jgi:outer membrane receptor protein involved in Fe transport
MRIFVRLAWVFCGFLLAAPAWAAESDAISTYPAAFFADARPATANDMIGRVPGFNLDNGSDTRGFAGSGGNVLINGVRPAAKDDSLSSILSRIPADTVERIEVIRGGAPGIDMQGQSVVANVILKADAADQLIVTTGITYIGSGSWHPDVAAEYHGQSGAVRYELSAARTVNIWDDSPGNGFRTVTPPGGPALRDHASTYGVIQPGYSLHGGITAPLWGGEWANNLTLNSNGLGYGTEYDSPASNSHFDNSSHGRSGEFGSHWQGLLGTVNLETILLQRLSHNENGQTSNTPSGISTFRSANDSGESIGRATARISLSPTLGLEGGGEITWNFLDGHTDFVSNGVGVTLPNANVAVDELRGETFANATWKIDPTLTLEAGVRLEFSRITESGDNRNSRDFFYPKPRLLLSWQADEPTQFRFRVEKLLGQLNFNDFVASSNLAGYGVAGGNASIRPYQSWQFEAAVERHFWGKGALVVSLLHEEIKDWRDYIPIGGGLDAPGNVDHATSEKLWIRGTIPLDILGLKNGLFKPNLYWQTSDLIDPVTGLHRRMSGQRNISSYYTISQDLEDWKSTWSINWGTAFSNTNWRIAQIQRSSIHNSPYVNFYWTYTPRPDLVLNFGAENFVPYRFEQQQYNFPAARDVAGPPTVQDVRIRTTPRFYFNIRKTF